MRGEENTGPLALSREERARPQSREDVPKIDACGHVAVNGPLRACYHPSDYEGAGRERYWEMTSEQRRDALKDILRATSGWQPAGDVQFAKGWLSEKSRHDGYLKSISGK